MKINGRRLYFFHPQEKEREKKKERERGGRKTFPSYELIYCVYVYKIAKELS